MVVAAHRNNWRGNADRIVTSRKVLPLLSFLLNKQTANAVVTLPGTPSAPRRSSSHYVDPATKMQKEEELGVAYFQIFSENI